MIQAALAVVALIMPVGAMAPTNELLINSFGGTDAKASRTRDRAGLKTFIVRRSAA
jgi:hypothetical protein